MSQTCKKSAYSLNYPMINAEIVPGVLAITSNTSQLKGFPICEDLSVAQQSGVSHDQSLLQIRFEVTPSLRMSDRREGKVFRTTSTETVGMELPLGRIGNVTCTVSFDKDHPELHVNRTLFYSGKLTIGNVHSVGWLLRDLCNVHLLNNGFSLLHGAALASDASCVALIGLSNTGKTTTVKNLLSEIGARTFGDDLFVTDGKRAFSCPYTTVNVSPSDFPKFRDRVLQRARRAIPFYEYFGPTANLTLAEYFGKSAISPPRHLDALFFLRRSPEFSMIRLSRDEAFRMLVASNYAEFTYGSNSLFRAHDYLLRKDVTSGAQRREEVLLKHLCANVDCYLIDGQPQDFASATKDVLMADESGNARVP